MYWSALEERSLLAVGGAERFSFLNTLVAGAIEHCREQPPRTLWTALLEERGSVAWDFFVVPWGESVLLDCEKAEMQSLGRALSRYKLRQAVSLTVETALSVFVIYGPEDGKDRPASSADCFGLAWDRPGRLAGFGETGLVYVDPRLSSLGLRVLAPEAEAQRIFAERGLTEAPPAEYRRMRLRLGVPEGRRDLPEGRALAMQHGLDSLGAIDWEKGCYPGQEITARTRYRGRVKKHLLPFRIRRGQAQEGQDILWQKRIVGTVRDVEGDAGLAMVSLNAFHEAQKQKGDMMTAIAPPDTAPPGIAPPGAAPSGNTASGKTPPGSSPPAAIECFCPDWLALEPQPA